MNGFLPPGRKLNKLQARNRWKPALLVLGSEGLAFALPEEKAPPWRPVRSLAGVFFFFLTRLFDTGVSSHAECVLAKLQTGAAARQRTGEEPGAQREPKVHHTLNQLRAPGSSEGRGRARCRRRGLSPRKPPTAAALPGSGFGGAVVSGRSRRLPPRDTSGALGS